jgi:predicted transcriptional regulator
MNKGQNFAEIRNRLKKLSDSLLGGADEIDYAEADQIISAAGSNVSSVKAKMYGRLYKQAQEYWKAGNQLPPLLKKALDDLRPITESARSEKELQNQAQVRVEDIVEQIKAIFSVLQVKSPEFVTAYRNKGDISDTDKKVLDEITEDLRKRLMNSKGNTK